MTQKYRRPGELANVVRDRILEENKALATAEELQFDLSVEIIERLLDVAFFASLLTEEGRPLRVALAYVPEIESAPLPDTFRRLSAPIPLDPHTIRKLSPALNPQRSMIAVRLNGGELEMWAIIHEGSSFRARRDGRPRVVIPRTTNVKLAVTAMGPGSIDVDWKQTRIFAFRGGTNISLGFFKARTLYNLSTKVLAKVQKRSPDLRSEWGAGALTRMVAFLGAARHGGTIIITNDVSLDKMLKFNPHYTFDVPDRSLKDAVTARASYVLPMKPECVSGDGNVITKCADEARLQADLAWRDATEYAAQLATVDGALVLSPELEIIGFGVMIKPSPPTGPFRVFRRNTLDEEATDREIDIGSAGGARHQSAVRWCAEHPGEGFAVVVSQDAVATIIVSSEENNAWLLGPYPPPALE